MCMCLEIKYMPLDLFPEVWLLKTVGTMLRVKITIRNYEAKNLLQKLLNVLSFVLRPSIDDMSVKLTTGQSAVGLTLVLTIQKVSINQ